MYLFMAARAELAERRIRPALARGVNVLADRYHDSTLAYQGARGLATYWPESFPKPDLTVLLLLEGELRRSRMALEGRRLDRIEREDEGFHRRVVEGYRELARREPSRFLVLDGIAAAPDLAAAIWDRVRALRVPA